MTTTLLLIVLLLLLIAMGTPVAVSLGASALAAWLTTDASPLLAMQRLYAGANSFPLLAVPLFMMTGEIMSAGGISRRIVRLAEALVGHLPGSLGLVCVTASMIFSGVSGSSAADVAAVGGIMIPALVKRGYSPARAAALQAASGSMGVIIPPQHSGCDLWRLKRGLGQQDVYGRDAAGPAHGPEPGAGLAVAQPAHKRNTAAFFRTSRSKRPCLTASGPWGCSP